MILTATDLEKPETAMKSATDKNGKQQKTSPSSTLKIINVSNRLPVKIGDTIERSSGGLVSAFEDLRHSSNLYWIGWSGKVITDIKKQNELKKTLRKDYHFVPIFLSNTQINAYYHGFSNSSLWPLLHYFPSYAKYEKEWFESYKEVNEIFAEKVLAEADENSVVWVHDYHLMLLPKMIKARRPDLKVGFFLHTPFPSYEVFRCLPSRKELLEGLLGADLIGFHTYNYLRHFKSAVLRITGIDSEMDYVKNFPMNTHLGVFPIGISWKHFNSILKSEEFRQCVKKLEETYRGRKIVLSVERVDYTKGIPEKLAAIDKFFTIYPDYRDKVVFIQIAVPSRESVETNQRLISEVEKMVTQINGRFATINNIPVHFIYKSIPPVELAALYHIADAALVTPVMDGMNLVAKEYVACKNDKPGVLILSEFAGAAQELFNANIINPYDITNLTHAIYQALTIKPEEARANISKMKQVVQEKNSSFWAESFLRNLTAIERSPVIYHKNPSEVLVSKLKKAERPVFVLDYDGTLREIETVADQASPSSSLLTLLENFTSISEALLYIVSGRKRDDLEKWLGRLPINLIGEHGYCFRPANGEWKELYPVLDMSWKPDVKKLMAHYALSTPGSYIEEKTTSLVWHYRRSDPDFGSWKAIQLMEILREMSANLPVEVRHGRKIVEVCAQQISKGNAVLELLQDKRYDMLFCAGDDVTDESMFHLHLPNMLTVKVGHGVTEAEYRLDSPMELRDLLAKYVRFRRYTT